MKRDIKELGKWKWTIKKTTRQYRTKQIGRW
jgi:hypothetical protein